MSFMGGQWYLLGKELDHRLKIYYRANSSVDRVVYRIVLGSIVMILIFNLFSLLPTSIMGYTFWAFFGLIGLFYSWPTRGKIIQESMTGQFGEFRYLDSFEKTVLLLSLLTFIISLPELPMFENIEALKLYFDPSEQVSGMVWNYLSVLYYPFIQYPKLYNLIWSFHFYFFGLGVFVFSFYCILRYFFSRRLSMLGVFSVISTWSFSRILSIDYFAAMSTTAPLIWVWSYMWSTKSATYRSGLLTGLVAMYITMLNPLNFLFLPITLLVMYFVFLSDKTKWYRNQWLKYNVLGGTIAVFIFAAKLNVVSSSWINFSELYIVVSDYMYRKAFFVIAPIGLILTIAYYFGKSQAIFTAVSFDKYKFKEITFGILSIVVFGIVFHVKLLDGFSLIWILSFLALIPLEWIFQSISRLRSKRNLIYALYILVCILDSHLENRIRIVAKMFLDSESFKFFIQL
jgi:hypothetical protein